jgi:hypothetical protein
MATQVSAVITPSHRPNSKAQPQGAQNRLVDTETGWSVPDDPPEDIELSREQFERLKETLADDDFPQQDVDLAAINKAGYKCWLHFMMYQMALNVERDHEQAEVPSWNVSAACSR